MLKLYYSPGACSLAPHILLEEIGAAYELVLVSIADGKTRSAEYLALNPKGRVPLLLTEDHQTLSELPAISFYIAQLHPEAKLMPREPLAAARCFEWFNWLSGTVHGLAFGQIWRPQRLIDDPDVFAQIGDKGRQNLSDYFSMIEKYFSNHAWAVGDAYTAVDPFMLVFYRWGNRIGLDMNALYPAWSQHADKLLARPAVMRAIAREDIPPRG